MLEAGGIIQVRDSSAGGAGQDPGDAVPTLILSTGCSRQPPGGPRPRHLRCPTGHSGVQWWWAGGGGAL